MPHSVIERLNCPQKPMLTIQKKNLAVQRSYRLNTVSAEGKRKWNPFHDSYGRCIERIFEISDDNGDPGNTSGRVSDNVPSLIDGEFAVEMDAKTLQPALISHCHFLGSQASRSRLTSKVIRTSTPQRNNAHWHDPICSATRCLRCKFATMDLAPTARRSPVNRRSYK